MKNFSWNEAEDDENQNAECINRRMPVARLERSTKTRRRSSPQTVNGIHRRRAKRIRW